MWELLDKINSPADLKKLDLNELAVLCSEIREYMVEVCSENPGHLASSLGAVELIVGIHYVFDTPDDKLVFDVGHQAYAHKILTGRKDFFRNLRTPDGVSGFPRMSESPYDAFGVGHSSTSISAALGYAEAARIRGTHEKSIAVIGDGALTGGLAYEALNNAGVSKADLLVILNDNNHSIDRPVGAVHRHLLRITSGHTYNKVKNKIWDALGDNGFRRFFQRWLRSLKSWIVKSLGGDLFEAMGLRYFGPIDGNDITQVVNTLRKMKNIHGALVLHTLTAKGKGYGPAELDPTVWHAPGKFDPETGERKVTPRPKPRFQDVFGKVLCELAEQERTVVGITPAMATGCSMTEFANRYPERFFDVGIEEEHAVTFSAGLAAAGMRPFCNIYSSFSQRAYDQIIHDVALQSLPVTLCFDRAGLVGEDGATHAGSFDMAAYRPVPNCIIAAPADELELKRLMYSSLQCKNGPYIIRYPRGYAEGVEWENEEYQNIPVGKGRCLLSGAKVAVIALGPAAHRAVEAAAQFAEGLVSVYDMRFLKPLDEALLDDAAQKHDVLLTVEDGSLKGGLFGAVAEYFAQKGENVKVRGLGIPDEFVGHSSQAAQRHFCGIDTEGIADALKKLV